MKPSHARLTCRAHTRFSPSIALWQHFVSPNRPCLAQLHVSSTASETAQERPNEQDVLPHSQKPSGRTQQEDDHSHEEQGRPNPSRLRLKKPLAKKGGDKWHANKVGASVAKNLKARYNSQKAEAIASEALLATARAAFKAQEDYTGVVVKPIIPPGSPGIPSALPWSVLQDERPMGGVDR
jgi:non-canonical poly(A) RNA polymerase PAPD5/7